MPDVIDEILDKLSPSALEILDQIDLESDRESRKYSEELQKLLMEMEETELRRVIREMDNKAEFLVRKTGECKSLLDKYREEFEKIHYMKIQGIENKKIKMYTQQIENLEKQLSELIKNYNPEELFVEITNFHQKIEELENQKKELSDSVKCYEGFPASIKEAQYCISDLKEKIKKKESLLECKILCFQGEL